MPLTLQTDSGKNRRKKDETDDITKKIEGNLARLNLQQNTPASTPSTPNVTPNTADSRASVDAVLASKPADFDYGQYDRILGMMENYQNREPFKYDLNADMLYQQYKNQYMQNGQRAMQDTVGQIAAVNGGYANSYAQTAGQQAYQNELGRLNEVIPELYQLAYSRYANEGDEMLKGISLANEAYQTRYGEYQDALANWRSDVNAAENRYADQRDFDYRVASDNATRELQRQQNDLENYMTAMGLAQQNAGNRTSIDATLNELVRMGIVDSDTAKNLSGVYSNATPAETPVKTSTADYESVRAMLDAREFSSEDELYNFLTKTAVASGWINDNAAYDLYREYVKNTPEGKAEMEGADEQIDKYFWERLLGQTRERYGK